MKSKLMLINISVLLFVILSWKFLGLLFLLGFTLGLVAGGFVFAYMLYENPLFLAFRKAIWFKVNQDEFTDEVQPEESPL